MKLARSSRRVPLSGLAGLGCLLLAAMALRQPPRPTLVVAMPVPVRLTLAAFAALSFTFASRSGSRRAHRALLLAAGGIGLNSLAHGQGWIGGGAARAVFAALDLMAAVAFWRVALVSAPSVWNRESGREETSTGRE